MKSIAIVIKFNWFIVRRIVYMITMRVHEMISNQDQVNISVLACIPDHDIQGILQFVHGMAEYKERYIHTMETFANQGYVCVIHDHRGHGKSVKSREDLGYFYESSGMYAVADTYQVSQWIKKQFPDVPLILLGHSMGSLIARLYCKRYDKQLDGLIVCGSPSKHKMLPIVNKIVKKIKKRKGDRYRSEFIQKLVFGSFEKKYKHKLSKNMWICSDPSTIMQYDKDELCGFLFTVNGFENLFTMLFEVYDKQHWVCEKPDLPILFISGKNDACMLNERKFKEAYGFMKAVGYQNVEHHLFPAMRHEILNEKEKKKVYAYIYHWLQQKNRKK